MLFKSHQGEDIWLTLTEDTKRAHIFQANEVQDWQKRIERVGFGAVAISVQGAMNSMGYTLKLGPSFVETVEYDRNNY